MSEDVKPALDRQRILTLEMFSAKPNKMFSEEQRQMVRFSSYSDLVACAECGRRSRTHWTLVCSFEARSMGFLIPARSGKVHLPLTPVCRNHLLGPAEYTPPEKPKKKKREGKD